MNPQLQYRDGYKYVTLADYCIQTQLLDYQASHRFFELSEDGRLLVRAGYAWDGASGLTIDTKSSIIGSLVHDVFYQMLREGLLPQGCFHEANEVLRDLCIEDGMFKWRANIWFRAVERFGNAHAAVQPEKVLVAP